MREEDHTLGNAIRYALNQKSGACRFFVYLEWCRLNYISIEQQPCSEMQRWFYVGSPNVTFCGYSVPHPLENKMHVHIQTKGIFAIIVEMSFVCWFQHWFTRYWRLGGSQKSASRCYDYVWPCEGYLWGKRKRLLRCRRNRPLANCNLFWSAS